jgi:hypothetical protein
VLRLPTYLHCFDRDMMRCRVIELVALPLVMSIISSVCSQIRREELSLRENAHSLQWLVCDGKSRRQGLEGDEWEDG